MAGVTSTISRLQPIIVSQTLAKHTASLIFLHGSGDTGEGIQSWLEQASGKEFSFPHIRVIFPTAPARPYTPNGGMPMNVWFDRQQISPHCAEDLKSIDEMCDNLEALVHHEVQQGIDHSRIILGGFSMGGAMALHYGYRFGTQLAGIFGLSCFLNDKSAVYEAVRESVRLGETLPRLFQAHGSKDPLVDPRWGAATHKLLRQLGVLGQFTVYQNVFHELNHKELDALNNWIWRTLPQELPTS